MSDPGRIPGTPDKSLQPESGSGNAVVPRAALERVFARAVELQAEWQSTGDGSPDGFAEGISEARMLEIAREVGIDPANVRQAIAEERARLPMSDEATGPLLEAMGPGKTDAQRTVRGSPAEVLTKLEQWMPNMELLEKKRRVGDRISWEPGRDSLGAFLRRIGVGPRQFDLTRTDQVAAVAMSVDESRTVVRLQADMYSVRRAQRTGFAALSIMLGAVYASFAIPAMLLLASGSLAAIAVALLTASFAFAEVGVWRAFKRNYRKLVERVHLRLEQLLDELEAGGLNGTPGLYHQVRDALLGTSTLLGEWRQQK